MKIKLIYPITGIAFFIIFIFCYVDLNIPFSDHDSLIYAYIGRGVLNGHFPYSYAFDHKPLFIYYFYAIMDFIYPAPYGLFVVSSIICVIFTSIIVCSTLNLSKINIIWITGLLILMTYKHIRLSGNTEFVYFFLSLASISLIINRVSEVRIIVSSFLAALSFQTNYISCVSLAPTLIYILLLYPKNRAKNVSLYSFIFIFSNIALFIPLFISGGGKIISNYFTLQYNFLSAYGNKQETLKYFVSIVFIFSGVYFIAICHYIKSKDRVTLALLIFSFFSFIACLLSGHRFSHYAYPLIASSTILILAVATKNIKLIIPSALPPIIFFSFWSCDYLNDRNQKDDKEKYNYYISEAKEIKQIVGNHPVLAVKSSHIPFYFGELTPFNPLIWASHSSIIYGDQESVFFADEINKKPEYILSSTYVCKEKWTDTEFCKKLRQDYKKVSSFNNGIKLDLYKKS